MKTDEEEKLVRGFDQYIPKIFQSGFHIAINNLVLQARQDAIERFVMMTPICKKCGKKMTVKHYLGTHGHIWECDCK
ncbi:MAG: hypothetical protein GOV02_03775, partial [Candidatus Aenigmarchaeota archaeon]|nr:hypothetical protein [Candidatus Aenigmarchaeota archaeon]